ncbi:MAG: VOC family protein [Nocardioides sp.]
MPATEHALRAPVVQGSVETMRWITAFLDLPSAGFDRTVRFWRDVTGYGISSTRGERDEFATLLPVAGESHLRVQRLHDGAPRVHLDLHVDDVAEAADRAVRRGARRAHSPHGSVATLSSPGGQTFCFVPHHGGGRARPGAWPGGHTSLVDQVCLDIPQQHHAAELRFWHDLTGWQLRRSTTAEEFHHLVRPEGMPIRLLLQRLGETAGGVRAHLDLATTDRDAETSRHERLGADVVDTHQHWTVLADPAGSPYCITDRNPESGLL